jgi:hypothetical protein
MSRSKIHQIIGYLPTLLAGRPFHGPERYNPFFIVGSGRCGSTLLRAMLEAHPAVHIPPENVMLRPILREYPWFSRLPWSVLLRVVLGNMAFHASWDEFDLPLGPVFRDLAERPTRARNLAAVLDTVYRAHMVRHKPAATRWGDKSTFVVLVLGQLRKVFPDLRVIHIVRDGRDVAASFADAFGEDLYRATFVWLRAVRAAHAFRDRHPRQYLELRYEELVRQPEETLREAAAFLGLEFHEHMVRHHELDLWLGDMARTPWMKGARTAVHQDSIGRWRTAFTPAQAAELERLLHPTLARLGYGGGV